MTEHSDAAVVANSVAISAVLQSIQELLTRCFAELFQQNPAAFRALPTVVIARTEDFANPNTSVNPVISYPSLSIFCNRVDVNRTMRPAWSAVAAQDGEIHLPLDIHFLLTPWDTDADGELRMLGAAMQCLEQHPILSGPRLDPRGGWEAGEAIQISFEDIVTEDVLRTFENLPNDFQLSVGYLARIARIEAPDTDHPDVMDATRGLAPSPEPEP